MILGNTPQEFFGAAAAAAAGGVTAGRSVRFNSADSAYLSRTPASAGNRRTWTWSGWLKRSAFNDQDVFSAQSSTAYFTFRLQSNNTLRVNHWTSGVGDQILYISSQVFRDPSSWYHFVIAVDTTQATSTDRIKAYVNNTQITTWSTSTAPSQNLDTVFNTANTHFIGGTGSGTFAGQYLNGYLALVHMVDGQALTPSSFGETSATTGQWIAKTYSGSYGTNGFFLDFLDNSNNTASTLGKDNSGNGNNWTPNNLSVTAGSGNDSLRDHPTSAGTSTGAGGEVSGNYCTLNPLDAHSSITLAQGNLYAAGTVTGFRSIKSTIAIPSTGKWYFEGSTNDYNALLGVATAAEDNASYVGASANGWSFQSGGYYNGSFTSGVSFSAGDILNFAVDRNNQKIWFGVNGTWVNSGNPATGANATFANLPASSPLFGMFTVSASAKTIDVNFGQRAWSYTAPSGFSPLVDTLLPTPTIAKPNTVMDVITYTGTGANATIPNVNTVPTSIGFKPDLVWIKGRSGATDYALYDLVRGVQKDIVSNSTAAETTQTTGLTAFGTNTFDIGTLAKLNTSSATYVAWCWDAGSDVSPTTNTSGTITSTVRANISAGFSIITLTTPASTGSYSVGHGLGIKPAFTIWKSRTTAGNYWFCQHQGLGNMVDYYIRLESQVAGAYSAGRWVNEPTSSLLYTNVGNTWNTSDNLVCYAWAPVAGYSSFGSYTGTGSATDSPFIWTGFRPAVVWVKRSNGAADWIIQDNRRPGYNTNTLYLRLNLMDTEIDSTGETNKNYIDFLSNGFKLRGSDLNTNGAQTYIYCAWAEAPFPYARAR